MATTAPKWGKIPNTFKQASPTKILLNVGCLLDIQTGLYEQGAKGEWILNGGVGQFEGITGMGNSNKTTFTYFKLLMVMIRYKDAFGFMYDTENSASLTRFIALSYAVDPSGELAESLKEEYGRWKISNLEHYDGTDWFNEFRKFCFGRAKADKPEQTPFLDTKGQPISWYTPVLAFVDSLSAFRTKAIQQKADTKDVGSSDLNTMNMQNAGGKGFVVDEMPNLTAKGGVYMTMSAHMGEMIVMDQYNRPQKKLADIKGDKKMKKVPESFTFLPTNIYEITGLRTLVNKGTGLPEFPLNSADELKGSTDLRVMTILPVRTKSGCTGIPFELIVSQRYGIQPTLSEFWYLKAYDRFGLNSNPVHNELDLYPGVKFTRQQIRGLIDSDPRFCRAMQITSDFAQMLNLWPQFSAEKLTFSLTDLREKLIADGYDWNELLDTRSYWTFDQYTNEKKFLSTRDLIEMYHGNYVPFWKK